MCHSSSPLTASRAKNQPSTVPPKTRSPSVDSSPEVERGAIGYSQRMLPVAGSMARM